MKNEPFEDVVPYWKSGCSIAMLVYQRVLFGDDHCLFDSPPTTNHQPQPPNCWLKKTRLKKPPFFEAYTKAHKWQHLLENCPTPGNSWSAMHLVEKASAKSWLVLAGSTQKSFFDMYQYQLIQAVTQLDSPGWRSPTTFEFGSWNFTLPKKVTDSQNWRVFLVFFYYKLSTKVFHLCWRKVFFSSNFAITHGFSQASTLQGAGKTIVARNLAATTVQQQVLPVEHLLGILKNAGKTPFLDGTRTKIQPHIIYTPFLLGIGYICIPF